MAATKTKGLFEQLGIDSRTQEQVLAQRVIKKKEERQAELDRPEAFAGDRAFRQAGQMAGDFLQEKFGEDPKLTPEEQSNVDALSAAQTKFESRKEAGDYLDKDGKPSLILESEGFNESVAAELIKIGDPRGAELAMSTDVSRRKRAEDTQERVKRGLEIDELEHDRSRRSYDTAQEEYEDSVERMKTMWPQGSNDPNEGVYGYMMADGTLVTGNKTEYPLGTMTDQRPNEPKLDKNGNPKATKLSDYMSTREAGELRAANTMLFQQFGLAVGLKNAVSDSIGENGTIEMMGTGGKISAAGVRLVDNISAIGRTVGKFIQLENADGEASEFDGSYSSAQSYVTDNKALFEGIALPEGVVKDSIGATRYQAILVQLAYGKAQINEPGGRISDNDFKAAVKQIAGAATNPEALRQVLVGDMDRSVRNFKHRMSMLRDDVQDLVIAPRAMKAFDEEFVNFNRAFDQPFGSAAAPSDALTSPQEEVRDGLGTSTPTPGVGASEQLVIDGMKAERDALAAELEALQAQ
jgi:hypothetical protein